MSSSPVAYFPSSPPQYTETTSPPISDVRVEIYARLVEIKMIFYQMNYSSFLRDKSHKHCKRSPLQRARLNGILAKIHEDLPLVMKDFRRRARFIMEVGIYMTEDTVYEVDRAMIEKMSIVFDAIFVDVTIPDAKEMVAIVAGGPEYREDRALAIADNVKVMKEQIKEVGFVLEGVCVSGNEFSINLSRKSKGKHKPKGKSGISPKHSKERLSITRSHGPKVVGRHVSSFSPRQVDMSRLQTGDAEPNHSEKQSQAAAECSSSHARSNKRQSGSASDFQHQIADYEATKFHSKVEELPSSDRTIDDDWEENDRLMRLQVPKTSTEKKDKAVEKVPTLSTQGPGCQSLVTTDTSSLPVEYYHEDGSEERIENPQKAELPVNEEYGSIEWPSSPPLIFSPIQTTQKLSNFTGSTAIDPKSFAVESSPATSKTSTIEKREARNPVFTNSTLAKRQKGRPSTSIDGENVVGPDKGNVHIGIIASDHNSEHHSKKNSCFDTEANTLKERPSLSLTNPTMFTEPRIEESPILPHLIPPLDSKKEVMKGLEIELPAVIDEEPKLNAWLSASSDVRGASKVTILETLAQLAVDKRKITSAIHGQHGNKQATSSDITANTPKPSTAPFTSMAATNILDMLGKKDLFGTKNIMLGKDATTHSHIVENYGAEGVRQTQAGPSSSMLGKGPRKRTREMSEGDGPTQNHSHDPPMTSPHSSGKCLVATNGSPVTGERRFKRARYNACTLKKRANTIDYYSLGRPFKRSRFGRRGTPARPACRDGKENPFLTTGTPDIVERRRLFFSKRSSEDSHDSGTPEITERFPVQYAEPGRIYDNSPEIMRSSLPKQTPPVLIAKDAISFVSNSARDRAMAAWTMSDEGERSQKSGAPSSQRKTVFPRIPVKRKSMN